jgi:glycosyltransferase involved in cell wall biosynthesis
MNPPKRILLLDTGNEWGGGTNSMFELLKRLDRERFSVTCCFYKDYRKGKEGRLLSEELAEIGISLIILPPLKQPLWAKLGKELARGLLAWSVRLRLRSVRAIDKNWRMAPRGAALQKILSKGQFELLYMNNQPSTNLEGYLAAEPLCLPIVQHCRVQPELLAAEAQLVNRLVSQIICVSHGSADVMSACGVNRRLITVVHNAIDHRRPMPTPVEPVFPLSGPVIGTVGRLTPLKSIHHLIEAVAALKISDLTVNCLILGEGTQREALETLASSLQIREQIHFVGFQSLPLAWVQRMDICVLSSTSEGLPRVVLEAMLSGKPVIGSDVTGTRELVVHEETGLLYAYGDVPALTAALRRLLADPALCKRMGQAGNQRVVEYFSIEAYVAGVSKVLAEAAK